MTMPAPKTAAYEVRALLPGELAGIARIHCAAFPSSGLSLLGEKVVERYYEWQLARVPGATTFVVCSGRNVRGFAVCGDTLCSTGRFMVEHAGSVVHAILRRPRMIADPRFVRFVSYAARVLLPRRPRAGGVAERSPAPAARRFWVEAIAVHPAERGRGLGSMLLSQCEQAAAAQGFDECFLAVEPENADAVRLYRRRGWEPVPSNGLWNGRMRKTLTPVNAEAGSTT
jgi:ribosomal protein S18 acetylase RimI-like enzyme